MKLQKAAALKAEFFPEIDRRRAAGQRIVFTNGCFDLLHIGHVTYLAEARSLGDCLVVGLNSDASVRRLKGAPRPFVPEEERLVVLSALRSVDLVTLFDEDSPRELIARVQPDVLVKGGDWPVQKIVGADVVLSHGGLVRSLPFIPGASTTSIVERIRSKRVPLPKGGDI